MGKSVVFLISVIVFLIGATSHGRWKVCTAPIHSSAEIEVFRQYLPSDQFDFIEFTPKDIEKSKTENWFRQSCQQVPRCDVVVISSEFAGSFFGKSGITLSLQDLEGNSCRQECNGLTEAPLEVFVMACNTLAEKSEDRRTPDEYRQVLLEHGFDRIEADRVVEARYGPLGASFRERMKRVYRNVPALYGFDSVAPLGEHTAPLLTQYFKAKGDYSSHLSQVASRRNLGLPEPPNLELLRIFRKTALIQTNGLSSGDPNFKKRELMCTLYDDEQTVEARLHIVSRLMRSPDFLAFLPTIESFLRKHPPETYKGDAAQIFEGLKDNPSARAQILSYVDRLSTSLIRLDMANFARKFDWLDDHRYYQIAMEGVQDLLSRRPDVESRDVVCELSRRANLRQSVPASTLRDSLFSDGNGVMMLQCLHIDDSDIPERLSLHGLSSSNALVRQWALYTIDQYADLSEAVIDRIRPLLHDEDPEVRSRAENYFQRHLKARHGHWWWPF